MQNRLARIPFKPSLFFLLSLFFLRVAEFNLIHPTLLKAYQNGITAGLTADLSLVVFTLGIGLFFLPLFPTISKITGALLTAVIWLIATANVCYFAFFQSQLFLWVAASYHENAWSVRSTILHLLNNPFTLISLGFFLLSIYFLFAAPSRPRPKNSDILKHLALSAAMIVLALLIHQSPVWLKVPRVDESIFSDNINWRWTKDLMSGSWQTRLPMDQYLKILPQAPELLKKYSTMSGDEFGALATQTSYSNSPEKLLSRSRELRKLLGYAPDQKLNFVILFLESGRAFELLNPVTQPEIYPQLAQIFAKHGLLFPRTYSTANYTVQGQFSTLCSRIDRMDSAPVYMRQPYLDIKCLPSVFSDAGYDTYWMNPYDRHFSGKYVFESNHGTKTFFDREQFKATTEEEEHNATEWGLSDQVFLDQALKKLEALDQNPKPFFAHLLTTGTHVPWRPLPDYPLTPHLDQWAAGNSDYKGYISTALGLDHALGDFFTKFFASPLSDHTVIVVMGDHGTGIIPPNAGLAPLQENLLWHRIIMGVVAKNIKQPKRILEPVHQMDVAPLIAAIAGLPQPAHWLGRDPLKSGEGTPWTKYIGGKLYYRTSKRICAKTSKIQCWALSESEDPLLDMPKHELPEIVSESETFQNIIEANEASLEFGTKNTAAAALSSQSKFQSASAQYR